MAVFRSKLWKPSKYTILEYIEATGTQYIDTGFVPNQDSRVVCDFQFTGFPTEWSCVFGSRTTPETINFCLFYNTSGFFRADYAKQQNSLTGLTATDRLVVDRNKNVCTIGTASVTQTAVTFTAPGSLFLLANRETNSANMCSCMRLYSCKVYDNGTLVRDLWPALRNADGAIGTYDRITDRLFTNAGTGEFIAGVAA